MDAVSVADANRIRAAMGLAPLPVPGAEGPTFRQSNGDASESEEDEISTLEKRTAAAGSNWAKLEAEKREVVERQKRKDAAKKQRDAAMRDARLQGKGLGDVDDGPEIDTKSWLLGQKKRQKRIEKQRLEQERRAEQESTSKQEYSSRDLKGLKVGHELDDFQDGEQILTLKDAEVGSDSGEDELENADLVEKEKLDNKLERKKKKPVYDPNEINETGESRLLAQYDEEIQGKKRKRFTLDEKGGGEKRPDVESMSMVPGKGIKISLDALMDDVPVSDYSDPTAAKIRKPKKAKKERKTRRREADEDEVATNGGGVNGHMTMDLDETATNVGQGANGSTRRVIEEIDDEDLQIQLASQRRQALKNKKKIDAAERARQLREEAEIPAQGGEESDEEPGMVIDETREFVSHLERPDSDSEAEVKKRRRSTSTPAVKQEPATHDEEEEDEAMSDAALADPTTLKRESSLAAADEPRHTMGLDEEDTTSSLGSVAAMLRKRGLIDGQAATTAAKKAESERRYANFLAANRTLIAEYDTRAREDRERDRNAGYLNNMSNVQRQEYARRENEKREAYLAQLQAQHFAQNYRPDVKLEYHDEFGRNLNQKEAFKHLSHAFHGKGSGKGKLEKRLKKIEDEKRREGKGMLDGGEGGYDDVMREQGKRRGQAGVRLQ